MITVISFGYLHGVPPIAANITDLRDSLRNPAADPRLRYMTGLYPEVQQHVIATDGTREIVAALSVLASVHYALLAPRALPVVLAVGCAGGRHRSVVVASLVVDELLADGFLAEAVHRDLHRPVVERNR